MPAPNVERKSPGDHLMAEEVNRIVEAIRSLGKISGTHGVRVLQNALGVNLSAQPATTFGKEPALSTFAVNKGYQNLKLHAPCQYDGHYTYDEDDVIAHRILRVRQINEGYLGGGRFCVCAEPIHNGQPGRVWVAGVCPVLVVRGNEIEEGEDHHYADAQDGLQYLKTRKIGGVDLLWEDPAADEDEPHLALIRLGQAAEIVLDVGPVNPSEVKYNGSDCGDITEVFRRNHAEDAFGIDLRTGGGVPNLKPFTDGNHDGKIAMQWNDGEGMFCPTKILWG